jgi:hypothetical protein
MTDAGGQTGRRSVALVAAGAATALLASLLVAALRPGTAEAATTLAEATRAVVVLPDGATRSAEVGAEVPRGATVRTDGAGAAVLRTRDRDVLLGASTAVTVLDGARQRLDRGLVMVDALDAPGLRLEAGAADVTVPGDGLTRVERGPAALRVAVLDGDAGVRSTGRAGSREVPRLFQTQVPYGGLPGDTTPLVLTPGDAWEERYALDLVSDDRALRALATGLETSTADREAVLEVVPASVVEGQDGTGAPAGERLLSYLLAASARSGGDDPAARYATVRGYRAEGGSWGVVAALVDSGAEGVSAALDDALGTEAVALPGSPATFDPSLVLGGSPSPSTGATRGPSPRPTRPGSSATPSPSAPPTQDPDLVDELVDTVLSILPSPAAPAVPGRSPQPSRSPGLLGGVTGPLGEVTGGLTGR